MDTIAAVTRARGAGDAGVTILLTQLTKAVYRCTSEAELGMRYRQFVALAFLHAHSGISQHEMGETMLVDPNNLVIVLNELEAGGLALRRRDPEDRRRHLVEITPEGRRALQLAEAAMAGVEDRVLAALSTSERSTLRRLLALAVDTASLAPAPA